VGLPWQIIQGDVRKVCKTLGEKSFDAVFCDPPFAFGNLALTSEYRDADGFKLTELRERCRVAAGCKR